MNPLKIYLLDLTYDTITLSTEAFPLNIGYIAAYTKERFGPNVEITLFKYIADVERELKKSPPDILGVSNYSWNHRIGREMSSIFSKLNPDGIVVLGGPNFPVDLPSQERFFRENPDVDIYVSVEGEIGFTNVVEKALEAKSYKEIRTKVLSKPIDGCITRSANGKLECTISEMRIKKLDEIPSPYLTGLMDKFFDGKLSPMLSTNRGCPFTCSFCVDGNDLLNQVNKFSLERVNSELEYIGNHITKNMHHLKITDLNFGMIPRDIEVCNKIRELQNKHDYPKFIDCTTGKNSKEKVIQAIKNTDGAIEFLISVQSMDQQVLENIRRSNISVEQMMELAPALKEANLSTSSEVILGLPGETYQSHINTIRDLVKAKLDNIFVYTCMLIDGSELATPVQRKKWGLETKYRILPRDFTKLSNGRKVLEIEEVAISTNTLTFDEYIELRSLVFSVFVTNKGIVYNSILKLMRENDLDVFELFYRTIKELPNAPKRVQEIFDKFNHATIDELWNSPEEIENFYQDNENYNKLLRGETGINVLHYFFALATAEYMEPWTEYITEIFYKLIKESKKMNKQLEQQFLDVTNYSRGMGFDPLGKERMRNNPEYVFQYDILSWLNDSDNKPLANFKLPSPLRVTFKFSEQQFRTVEDALEIYGHSTVGISKAITTISRESLFRNPEINPNFTKS